ncbi:MAG TPA: YraN family protein [Novimethylophilus sp.]|jgi:putative endonuclease|uniref:YraN family protein n=1 Tax=Novimethylophilus sp. TaxID=2137426 RepID=UPI002F3FA6B6
MRGDGPAAEKLAVEFLQRNGLRLIESNFRSRHGEIDLILRDGDTIVFAEVRLRSNSAFGGAAASITPAKQAKIIRTAQFYLQHTRSQASCRFDAVLLESLDATRVAWIKNAFEGE